jgi:hypothetical protein
VAERGVASAIFTGTERSKGFIYEAIRGEAAQRGRDKSVSCNEGKKVIKALGSSKQKEKAK